jgi:hypothetical protein
MPHSRWVWLSITLSRIFVHSLFVDHESIQIAEDDLNKLLGDTSLSVIHGWQDHQIKRSVSFFFANYIILGDTHNTRTQTLPLGASSKTVPANPQD